MRMQDEFKYKNNKDVRDTIEEFVRNFNKEL